MSLPRMLRPTNLEEAPVDSGKRDEDAVFVGSEIRSLRNARDITLQDLGAATGLSIGYLSHTDTTVRLYLQESFTFLMLTAEAAVALSAATPA